MKVILNRLSWLIMLVTGLLISDFTFAENIKLETNEANCKKVNGYGQNDKMSIAMKYKVPLSSVQFMGARWQDGQYGGLTCVFIFDTAAGPKRCQTLQLLSDDQGKSAFGAISLFENPMCW
jgi:hypothetical protein